MEIDSNKVKLFKGVITIYIKKLLSIFVTVKKL